MKTPRGEQPAKVGEQSGAASGHLRLVPSSPELPEKAEAQPTCSIVASTSADPIDAALRDAASRWATSRNRTTLRRQLVGLLAMLEED